MAGATRSKRRALKHWLLVWWEKSISDRNISGPLLRSAQTAEDDGHSLGQRHCRDGWCLEDLSSVCGRSGSSDGSVFVASWSGTCVLFFFFFFIFFSEIIGPAAAGPAGHCLLPNEKNGMQEGVRSAHRTDLCFVICRFSQLRWCLSPSATSSTISFFSNSFWFNFSPARLSTRHLV